MVTPTLDIRAACDNSWNSGVLSGNFTAVGGYGDYTIYDKGTMDGNGNWWFLYFDTNEDSWRFSYSNEQIQSESSLWETPITPFDSKRPGYFRKSSRIGNNNLSYLGFNSSHAQFFEEYNCEFTIDGQNLLLEATADESGMFKVQI